MKTLVYKVNAAMADASASEFGLLVIKAKKNVASATYFGIRFESYYDDVEIEYDTAIKVSGPGNANESAQDNYNRAVEEPSGKYLVPKATGTIGRFSNLGVTVWFPWDDRTEVEVKVHHAYNLGGIQHINYSQPTPSYYTTTIDMNLLDCMGLSKLSTSLNFNIYMEDKPFDFRNFIHFPNLVSLNGGFNNPGTLWFAQKLDRSYDVDYLNLTNTIYVDNDTFNRRFNEIRFDGVKLVGTLTTLSGFKVKTILSTANATADKFATLLVDVSEPFFSSCDIKLAVSDAITEDTKHNLYVKAQAAGGHIYFDYDPEEAEPWTEYTEE